MVEFLWKKGFSVAWTLALVSSLTRMLIVLPWWIVSWATLKLLYPSGVALMYRFFPDVKNVEENLCTAQIKGTKKDAVHSQWIINLRILVSNFRRENKDGRAWERSWEKTRQSQYWSIRWLLLSRTKSIGCCRKHLWSLYSIITSFFQET